MSDLIDRQAAIDAIKNQTCLTYEEIFNRCLVSIKDENGWLGGIKGAIEALIDLPSAQPEPCEYVVSAVAVEEMLKNLLPERGMWEIEGDDAKTAICETIHDALDGLWRLPFVKPDSKELSSTHKALDTISRQAAIDAIDKALSRTFVEPCGEMILKDLPSAQPEIVRCKDCKHWKDSDGTYRRGQDAESKCPVNSKAVYDGNWYCAWAERRTDD